jgi:hypothetical protein
MTTTRSVLCTAGVYTVLASNVTNISFRADANGAGVYKSYGSMAIATSLPGPTAANGVKMETDTWHEFSDLSGVEHVYWLPEAGNVYVQVIAN